MQKFLLIASLCIVATVAQTCSTYTCLASGATCKVDCGNCIQNMTTCIQNSAGNNTILCGCLDQLIACEAPLDPNCRYAVRATFSAGNQGNCSTFLNQFVPGATCPTQCTTLDAYPTIPAVSFCNPATLFCNQNTSKCAAFLTPGAVCNAGDACVAVAPDTTPYSCQNGTCQKVTKLGYAYDPCTTDNDCSGTLTCNTTTKACNPLAVGTACTLSAQCVIGAYCSYTSFTCQPNFPAAATNCTTYDSCGDGFVCTREHTCAVQYSKPIGTPCTTTLECAFGSFCPSGLGLAANCTAYPSATCAVDADCVTAYGVGSTCACIAGKKTCNVPGAVNTTSYAACTTQATALFTCIQTNGCRAPFGNVVPSTITCVGSKCGTQAAAFATCIGVNAPNPYCAVPTSAATGGATSTPATTKKNGASSVAITIMLLVAMIAALF